MAVGVVVTGATGFIGRHLVARLSPSASHLVLFTRDKAKLAGLRRDGYEAYQVDIADRASLEYVASVGRVEVLFHLAAAVDFFGGRKALYRANVEGTGNLLAWAARMGARRFVFASSIEAMGPVQREAVPADVDHPCRPVSAYGESKREAETRLEGLAAQTGVGTTILRLGNVYGPGHDWLIVELARALLHGDPKHLLKYLPLYGDRYLHPVYVADAVDAFIKAADEQAPFSLYTVAGREYATVAEMAALVAQSLGVGVGRPRCSRRESLCLHWCNALRRCLGRADLRAYLMAGDGRHVHRAYSIERAVQGLGYNPQTSLREGVAKTLAWARGEGLL